MTRAPRTYYYDLHGLLRIELDVAGGRKWADRLMRSKMAAFASERPVPFDIAMQIGPFRPHIPAGAIVIDKHFHCAAGYICHRGPGRGELTEIDGLSSATTRIRYEPPVGPLMRHARGGLRGINMYLEPLIKQHLLRQNPPALLMHGAAVVRGGKALVLFGTNGTFKTRLALDLCLHHGFRLLGDDLVLLRAGEALDFVEHPAVLGARARAAQAGREPKASRWKTALQLLLNRPTAIPPSMIAPKAPIAMIGTIQRSAGAASVTITDAEPNDVWDVAEALERFELSKHQQRYRQVANFARFAMAYEYALPGSDLFSSSIGATRPMPEWLGLPALECQMPDRYDATAADELAARWNREVEGR